MKNLSLLILICIIFLPACKKEVKPYTPIERCADLTNNLDSINKYIQGTWERMEEVRLERLTGLLYSHPNTPGWRNYIYKFSGDTVTMYNNGIQDSVYRFKIQRELEITNFPMDSSVVMVYYSFFTGLRRRYIPIVICKTQLIFLNNLSSDVVGDWLCLRR